MKRTDRDVPKALHEVWAWKKAIYCEVKDLPTDKALAGIIDSAERVSAGSGSRAKTKRHRSVRT